jgi:hypothetical protein
VKSLLAQKLSQMEVANLHAIRTIGYIFDYLQILEMEMGKKEHWKGVARYSIKFVAFEAG